MSGELFATRFQALTGNDPLSWQTRMYHEHFARGDLSKLNVIDLPTGLGKTMVMAIWLIAREINPEAQLPRRLIYVVDRRTVVDQATELAITLRNNSKDANFEISTLRGQLADNREWSRDPSKPAIIIGTVDLIGSALLFSGYRSSYKRRPLEAGLLVQDSLLLLDEAHLSKPFEKLLTAIEGFNKAIGTDVPSVKPLRVIRMSATSGKTCEATHFKIDIDPKSGTFDLWSDIDEDGIEKNQIKTRFEGKKRLKEIITISEKDDLKKKLADAAIELGGKLDLVGKRIVVFVRKPDDAQGIAEKIRAHAKTSKSKSNPAPKGIYANSVEVLTGTLRGLERDELVEKAVMKRFLDGGIDPRSDENQAPVFLIATSAGEVGFDLNADHMVCDATTIDSLIQRLGRVNRRGTGDATIIVVAEKPKMKDNKPVELKGVDLAIANTTKLLVDGMSLSPQKIASLKSGDWSSIEDGKTQSRYELACTPEPNTVPLTDILLDAWSMTSITDRLPGRPDVGPWLRGIEESEPPQTTIAWRAELDLEDFGKLDSDDIAEWFDAHPVLTHETLTVKTSDAANWFVKRWKKIEEHSQPEIGDHPVLINRAGMELLTLREVIRRLEPKSSDKDDFLRGAALVVPASFGGIERGKGLLDESAPETPSDEAKKSIDEQTTAREQRRLAPDVADERGRYREVVFKTEDSDAERKPLVPASMTKPKLSGRFTLSLASDDERTVKLISYVPRFEKFDTGLKPQSLEGHVKDVRKRADDIIKALQFDENHPIRLAFEVAADWHDHGKNRERWQRSLMFPKGFKHPGKPMAKSGGEMRRDPRGYRHEFGSLRELIDAFNSGKLIDCAGTPITQSVFDLAMHLIATHHGRGRPHFAKGGFDPEAEDRSDAIHTDLIRRFARLQRTYGWWGLAWLENLLRCADALASANPETDTYDAEEVEQ
jgi:CRISPR-associated endonuclease/helicase Cas3